MSPADGRHPPAPPPRCSCYKAEASCAVWRDHSGRVVHHGAGTLTSANCRSPGHGTGFGARRFMSRCSERDDSAAWNHLAGSEVEPLPVMVGSPCAGRGPTRAPDLGDDTSLRVIAAAPHHRIYKRMGCRAEKRGVVLVLGVSFLLVVSGVLFQSRRRRGVIAVPESSLFLSHSSVVPAHRSFLHSCQLILSGLGSTTYPFACWLRSS